MRFTGMSFKLRINSGLADAQVLLPGLVVCGVVAFAALFLSEHYGAPAMLMALLLGLALRFLVEDRGRPLPGIEFASKSVLRIGVALLGARISLDLFANLGIQVIVLIVGSILLTVSFALGAARLLGRSWRMALLTGGAVSICGASAALAIAAVLPKNQFSERNLTFTVFGVTILSTLAMVIYPIIVELANFDTTQAGLFLGGTIHDVAQVVGAGFTVSEEVGEAATTIKLVRVSTLAPFVLLLTLGLRSFGRLEKSAGRYPPIIPGFVVVFLVLASVNSMGWISPLVQTVLWTLSKWALLSAIAAVGMKTELRGVLKVPRQSVVLIIAETVFIAGIIFTGAVLFG